MLVSRQLKGDHARDVSLQRQHLQVEHQSGVIGIERRHAERAIGVRPWILFGGDFGLLDTPLHVAHALQILVDAVAVAGAKRFLQPAEFFGHAVEQARSFLERRLTLGRAPLFAEQILEHDARVGLGRQRRRRR